MSFTPVPSESRKQIDKAGELLAKGGAPAEELGSAMELANRWRACHAYPINTFQANMRAKLKKYRRPIVAQRLKRMPTIVDKLSRYPAMHLTTMQDIGGVRAILGSVAEVYRFADSFRNSRNLTHELIRERDYIADPRSEDGYRSLHLIYRYRNVRVPAYDGLNLELQIRTKLQHNWATAVETMGTFLGQALKSRQGDQEWIDFFALVASAFAHREKCPVVPRFRHLSRKETIDQLAKAEAALGALEKMRGFSVAVEAIADRRVGGKSSFYHLIILDSLARKVHVEPFDRNDFERAVAQYNAAESRAAQSEKIEPVLVSAGPIGKLRRAYPNFFLDITAFASIVDGMIRTATKAS